MLTPKLIVVFLKKSDKTRKKERKMEVRTQYDTGKNVDFDKV